MKCVTFNIRCDWGQDGNNCFEYRKPLILEKINREQPDIICFQEVLPHIAVWLKKNLTDYYVVGCGRGKTLDSEQMTIAYRKDHMNLIHMETWWLSKTPNVPGSRYEEQSDYPRTATEAVFQDMETEKVFRVVNTHLDHEGQGARRQGLMQIVKKLAEEVVWADVPTVLVGDFNAEPDSEEMAVLLENRDFVNATNDIGVTYHGYHGEESAYPGDGVTSSIDYIFLKGNWVCEAVEKWKDHKEGVYLSDHYPVCAIINP